MTVQSGTNGLALHRRGWEPPGSGSFWSALRGAQLHFRLLSEACRAMTAPLKVAYTLKTPLTELAKFRAALGEVLREFRLNQLHTHAEANPELRAAAAEIDQAARQFQQLQTDRFGEIELRLAQVAGDSHDQLSATPPIFEDPGFWHAITPVAKQVTDAVREAMVGSQGKRSHKTRVDVEEARRRAETYVERHGFPGINKLARLCNCSPSTVRKAIKASEFLLRAQASVDRGKARPLPRSTSIDSPSWAMQVDEALRQLIEYAPESERARLNSPGMRQHLAEMRSDELEALVANARNQAEAHS